MNFHFVFIVVAW